MMCWSKADVGMKSGSAWMLNESFLGSSQAVICSKKETPLSNVAVRIPPSPLRSRVAAMGFGKPMR
jgi:hypothetical protein